MVRQMDGMMHAPNNTVYCVLRCRKRVTRYCSKMPRSCNVYIWFKTHGFLVSAKYVRSVSSVLTCIMRSSENRFIAQNKDIVVLPGSN